MPLKMTNFSLRTEDQLLDQLNWLGKCNESDKLRFYLNAIRQTKFGDWQSLWSLSDRHFQKNVQ